MKIQFQPVIGLEIHIELKTNSKMFCGCRNNPFKAEKPNIYTCPVCLGLPGALPVPNRRAVEWTILIGQALNCRINQRSKFDRKHYFYPDLPKGYQISQYDEPIASRGWLKLKTQNSKLKTKEIEKKFRIHRVHLEEDTGKLIHKQGDTLIDFNRSGVPLVEIVTEPDFDNAEDVKAFLEELHTIIRYLGVSDANMEEGSMRLEPNISIKVESRKSKVESNDLPKYKVEVKNINSFRFVKQAIEYELERQQELLKKGETPIQETRGFDEKKVQTYSQRSKEQAHDYRYFPEPDIPPMEFSNEEIERIKKMLPVLPSSKYEQLRLQYKLNEPTSHHLTHNISNLKKFEGSVSLIQKDPDLMKIPNINQGTANIIINKTQNQNLSPSQIVDLTRATYLPKETNHSLLSEVINKVILNNPKAVEDYKNGKQNSIMFLIGQVMKQMKGKTDAMVVKKALENELT